MGRQSDYGVLLFGKRYSSRFLVREVGPGSCNISLRWRTRPSEARAADGGGAGSLTLAGSRREGCRPGRRRRSRAVALRGRGVAVSSLAQGCVVAAAAALRGWRQRCGRVAAMLRRCTTRSSRLWLTARTSAGLRGFGEGARLTAPRFDRLAAAGSEEYPADKQVQIKVGL